MARTMQDRMPPHECPSPGCETKVPYHQLACLTDWRRLPGELKRRVNDAYHGPGQGSAEHMDAIAWAIEWWRGNPR